MEIFPWVDYHRQHNPLHHLKNRSNYFFSSHIKFLYVKYFNVSRKAMTLILMERWAEEDLWKRCISLSPAATWKGFALVELETFSENVVSVPRGHPLPPEHCWSMYSCYTHHSQVSGRGTKPGRGRKEEALKRSCVCIIFPIQSA